MFLRLRRFVSVGSAGSVGPPSPSCSACAAIFAFTLLLALSSAGCGRFTRTRQCRALIAQVNPALDEVLALTDAGAGGGSAGASARTSTGSTRYVAAAARYERLAKELGPMEFSSEQMAKSVAEYASVLTATAQTLRSLAAALDANNTAEADRANHELERLSIREHSAISRMDTWCQPE
jgi:hypothetical protein